MTWKIAIDILLVLAALIWVNWDFLRHHKDFWEGIKGGDKILQPHELVIYVYIRILPVVILTDLFMNLTVKEEVWYSLDAIFFILIAGDVGHNYVNNRKKD